MTSLIACMFAAVLVGETSHPVHSFYAEGTPVEVEFAMSGMKPGEKRTLDVSVTDERDRSVGAFKDDVVADGEGNWRKKYTMPSSRLGFYRVRAKAGDAELPKVGSRPKGILTYAVVHDPEKRPFIAERDAFFGMFGNPFGDADLRPWAGMHRDIDGGHPAKNEKDYKKEYARREKFAVYGTITASRLRTDVAPYIEDEADRKALMKHTWPWELVETPEGEALYRKGLTSLAKAAVAHPWPHTDQPRIYEIFWEPDLTMKNPAHLVKTAAIAYETIHAADTNALVAVPTFAGTGTGVLLRRCLDAGLGKYMDVFSIHPYVGYPPDAQDFVGKLRAMRSMIREATGRDVPMVATESGAGADGLTPGKELLQLDGQVTCHLTTLGEGFLFHNAFHGFDYNVTTMTNGDIGISYNLCLYTRRWNPNRVSPRPAVAGLSAASWILDGKRPTCRIEWLSEESRGYAYADAKDNCVIALWDWTDPDEPVTLPVGRDEIEVADIMGNVTKMKTAKGELTIKIGRSPQYILDPDPAIWGRAAQAKLKWSERKRVRAADLAPAEVVEILPTLKDGALALRTEIRNRTEGALRCEIVTSVSGSRSGESKRALTLKPGEQMADVTSVAGLLGGPFDEHSVDVKVLVDGKEVAKREEKVNFLVARRIKAGRADPFAAWTDREYIQMAMPVKRQPGLHTGPEDLSAKAAFAWCDDYLLMDIVAEDDSYRQPTNGVSTWNGDCVQISVARRAIDKPTNNGYADVVEQARTETSYAYTPIGPESYRTATWDWTHLPVGRHGEGLVSREDAPYEVTLDRKPSGRATLRYLVAMPWKWLRMETPRGGEDVRFAISVNDMDVGSFNTISAIEAFNLKVVKSHGHIVLAGEGYVPPTGEVFPERVIHLDLARQMETLDFVKDYIDFAADNGFTCVKLYLEGRLRTPTTQVMSDEETYPVETIRAIREKAKSRGIEISPSVEALGHMEHFFASGKYRHLAEERDGDCRWDMNGRCTTICPSLPEAREFLAKFLTEVAEMFPESRVVGVGMDESWHMGFCRLCRERRKKEGFGGIYIDHVKFVNGVLNRAGKTAKISDDFFEFFPERLAECPKNVLLSHWIYDRYVSRWGHRGHFAQRIRVDLLRRYRELGLQAMSSCSMWYDYHNIRALTEYAEAAGCAGMLFSQWEMQDRFHGQFAPVAAGIGEYWRRPNDFVAKDFAHIGLSKVFPKLTDEEKDLIVPTMHMRLFAPQTSLTATLNLDPRVDKLVTMEAAIRAFRRSAYAPGPEIAPRALSPEALADDYVCQLRIDCARERLRLIGPELSSPHRSPERVTKAREELAVVRAELVELAARRRAQHAVWRRGCRPVEIADKIDKAIAVADELAALPVAASEDEWWLEFDLSMPEYHQHPYWDVYLKTDEGGAWKRIEGGYWKAGMRDWANFERIMPFRFDARPVALRIEYHGRGPCSMNYATVENRGVRLGPKSITRTEGLVRNVENLLVDNWKSAAFGWPDTMETFHRPELQEIVSAVEFDLKELR
ncbi:MAG: family 20 glycosylhydrolase [Kiritimatiellae bacterium]|nr:family 20 glycosylhydrolase [Kiritimatiellia bacterium]